MLGLNIIFYYFIMNYKAANLNCRVILAQFCSIKLNQILKKMKNIYFYNIKYILGKRSNGLHTLPNLHFALEFQNKKFLPLKHIK